MDRLQRICNLYDISPEDLFGYMDAVLAVRKAHNWCEMPLGKGFREGVIVRNKNQGAISEPRVRECQKTVTTLPLRTRFQFCWMDRIAFSLVASFVNR